MGFDVDEHEVAGHARLAIVDVGVDPADQLLETGHQHRQLDVLCSRDQAGDVGDRALKKKKEFIIGAH